MLLGFGLCAAYVAGLLLSRVAGFLTVGGLTIPWVGFFGLASILLGGTIATRHLRLRQQVRHWILLGGVFWLATLYITVRSPAPAAQDISLYVERVSAIAPTQVITGRLIDEPSLNRDLKGRFRVAVQQLQVLDDQSQVTFQIPVQGQVYVTAPLLQTTGLHFGQLMKAKGRLYVPQSALNPNAFDFQAYLAQRNAFAGFVAEELRFHAPEPWGLWRIRQRIVRAQLRALGSPKGQLVSATALGRKAVDLPIDIRDVFSQVGLAHTIAASGFHVSLLLGSVLALLRSRTGRTQAIVGGVVLLAYVTLTGLQASVVRAALMGGAMLIGLAFDRKVIPIGALLMAVTLILLVNPTWIWDIGFQLSVMATFGLIMTVPAITQRLDWLPVTLASLVAVPLAATLWTLPLTFYHFNVFAGLSIPVNLLATPLVTVVSLGGIGSSALALLWPSLGSFVAQGLNFPTQALLWLAQTSSHLPGSSIAIGQITLWQLIGLYAVLAVSLRPVRLRPNVLKPLLPIVFILLILLPIGWRLLTQNQVTVLAAGDDLVWVSQKYGRTTLINTGGEKTAFYTVAPFLKQSGVNQLDAAIALPSALDDLSGWQTLLRQTPSKHFYSQEKAPKIADWVAVPHLLTPVQSTAVQGLTVQLLGAENPVLRLTAQQTWLLLPALDSVQQTQLAALGPNLASDVLVWPGSAIEPALLQAINPQVMIGYGRQLPESVERSLQQAGIQTFWTNRDGAVMWHHRQGFHGYLETKHRNVLPWG